MKAATFKNFLSDINSFPLWVKQVIFQSVKSNLANIISQNSLNMADTNMLQIYRPELTYIGKKELSERINLHEEVVYTFLKALSENKSIIEITLDCFFTLEEISKLCVIADKQQYIKPPKINIIKAMYYFLSGETKTGEYLVQLGRITIDQLDSAIRYQESLADEGKKMMMGEVLTTLNFIQKDELSTILYMKSEAKKRFIFNLGVDSGEISDQTVVELRKTIEKLEYENNYLKTKINALLKNQ